MTPREKKKMQVNALSVLIGGASIIYTVAFSFANDFGRVILASCLALTVVALGVTFFGVRNT
ncbi:MAG: hypothetical protein KDD36_04540 [Flavobacteriales bacterium]|nr:hypothetical protein [Flavobacteriales bacterium]